MTLVTKWPVNSHHLCNSCQWKLNKSKHWYQLVVHGAILRSELTEPSFKSVFYNLIEFELLQTVESVKYGNSDSFSRSILTL
jgi:hypothetical protein